MCLSAISLDCFVPRNDRKFCGGSKYCSLRSQHHDPHRTACAFLSYMGVFPLFTLFTLYFDSAECLFECKNSFVKVRGLLCGYSETEGIAPLFRAFAFTHHLSAITFFHLLSSSRAQRSDLSVMVKRDCHGRKLPRNDR